MEKTKYTEEQKKIMSSFLWNNKEVDNFLSFVNTGEKGLFKEKDITELNELKKLINSIEQKTKVKNQHYVPQFYLRKFVNPESKRLEVLDMQNKKVGKSQSPKKVCSDQFFYSEETGKDSILSQVVEHILGHYECSFSKIYDKLCSQIISGEKIDDGIWYAFCVFVSVSWMRTDSFRQTMNRSSEDVIKQMSKIRYRSLKEHDPDNEMINKDGVEEGILKGKFSVSVNNIQHLRFMVDEEHIRGFANLLAYKKARIYVAKGDRNFVISDDMVTEVIPGNPGIFGRHFCDKIHYFVLSPKILVEFISSQEPGKQIKRKQIYDVDVIYYNTIRSIYSKYLYSCSKDDFNIEEYTDVQARKLDDLLKLFPDKFLPNKKYLDEMREEMLALGFSVKDKSDYEIFKIASSLNEK